MVAKDCCTFLAERLPTAVWSCAYSGRSVHRFVHVHGDPRLAKSDLVGENPPNRFIAGVVGKIVVMTLHLSLPTSDDAFLQNTTCLVHVDLPHNTFDIAPHL